MIPFCDTPWQSVAAALVGGVAGGLGGLALGADPASVVGLAGTLDGLAVHVVRRDPQFVAAVSALRGE